MSDAVAGSSSNSFQNMTDSQLRQAITQISSAAAIRSQQSGAPSPQPAHPAYFNNIRQWSVSVTPPPTNGRTNPSRTRTRAAKGSTLASAPQPAASTSTYHLKPTPSPAQIPAPLPPLPHAPAPSVPPPRDQRTTNPPRAPLPTTPQALHSTYASRLRTGTTLLVQPILANPSLTAVTTRSSRRGGAINYAEPNSGDEFPDAGAIESGDDSDFVASGGTRSAVRHAAARLSSKAPAGAGVFHAGTMTPISAPQQPPPPSQQQQQAQKNELDQSYLGMVPPARFITAKPVAPTKHEYFPTEKLEAQARKPTALVPIRVEFETDTHRIRDCFVWNLHEDLIKPETFARTFCADLDIPANPWAELVANQIRAQLEEHEAVAALDLGVDAGMDMVVDAVNVGADANEGEGVPAGEEVPECRVILSIDVQIATYHLLDHIEWDLLSPLTPEAFASTLCADLGLAGEAVPLVAHAIHEELVKHKRDALEWGVIGPPSVTANAHPSEEKEQAEKDKGGGEKRDRSGLSLLKDKTGLGLGWGRTPKEGRGPKPLRSVWRDWAEAEEFRTRFEVLSAEEVERREIERERASRRLRRETSKFQSQATTRRRRY